MTPKPILAKIAATIWLIFGCVMAITLLFLASKFEGQEATLLLFSLIIPTAFILPAYRILINKAKGVKLTSVLIFCLSLAVIFTQRIPTEQFFIHLALLCTSFLGFIGDKKYKIYVNNANTSKKFADPTRFQILQKGISLVVVDSTKLTARDDLNKLFLKGYILKSEINADTPEEALAYFEKQNLSST
ncbi:hypothetical protein [Vibrio ezurae]|uniref:Uncharacterized protein n=1 Tax=Vibrio ezurae NBRC 102218 TaxID=1219080 RepID=U3AZC6_9VIBR|nr:hypothetical protein [Vibrio ezurae]GAD79095.1 hypothetical protein VEZ01S_08_01310 [Vibrio ezurae NBRC 102218]